MVALFPCLDHAQTALNLCRFLRVRDAHTEPQGLIVSSAPTHRSGGASGILGTARLLGQTLGTTLVALLFRMFAEGHRAQACLLLAIFFAIAAGVVSSIRMTQASPAGKK